MHPQLLSSACKLFNAKFDELVPLSGGHYNAVYRFPDDDKSAILRIGLEDCPPGQTLAMLKWVHFLSMEDAPVAAPIPSVNGYLLERLEQDGKWYTITAFEKAEGTLAENIPTDEWTDDLFSSIGKAAGKMHATSKRYKPSQVGLTRPMWFDSYEIHAATRKLGGSSNPAREKLALLIDELKQLPSPPTDFCLIHNDLHFANFLIKPDGHVVIIDFDDCVYGWFAMDVSMALFDILVLYNAPSEAEQQRFALRFLRNYLNGYKREHELSSFWQVEITRFLKLKELCIYADLIGHPDVVRPDTWVGRFMTGREERVANDVPYVDIDFMAL